MAGVLRIITQAVLTATPRKRPPLGLLVIAKLTLTFAKGLYLQRQGEKQRKVSPTNCRHTIAFVSTVTDEKYANDNRQIPFAIPQKFCLSLAKQGKI